MANYFYPERDQLNHIDCLEDSRLHRFAREALDILDHFPQLWVHDIQVKPPHMPNACFYTYPRGDDHTRIINLTIVPSDLKIEFRMSQYLPVEAFHQLAWQNVGSNKLASLNRVGKATVLTWIEKYLENLWPDYLAGDLKRGGTSAMEGILSNYLRQVFPNKEILRNHRPDTFRGKTNRPRELDVFLPDLKIAFEIQGPRHDEAAVAERDQEKIEMCRAHGIGLIWINWERARRELLSKPADKVIEELRGMISAMRSDPECFYSY